VSFREDESDLSVCWEHGFGLKARRKIFYHEILWTVPLDDERTWPIMSSSSFDDEHPWPGNILPSVPPEPSVFATKSTAVKVLSTRIQFYLLTIFDILFQNTVFIINNWRILLKIYFFGIQILFVREIYNIYISEQVK
jgi:hypothetical protein